jgi:hypothetical protein
MCPHMAVITVMTFPPDTLRTFIGTMSPSDFLSLISCSYFIIACSTYSFPYKKAQDLPSCQLFILVHHAMLSNPEVAL